MLLLQRNSFSLFFFKYEECLEKQKLKNKQNIVMNKKQTRNNPSEKRNTPQEVSSL
jgi:hypothetical protein